MITSSGQHSECESFVPCVEAHAAPPDRHFPSRPGPRRNTRNASRPRKARTQSGRARKLVIAVPRQISRPAMAALTWAGLIKWRTIKVPVVVQVDLRPHSRELLAGRPGPIVPGPQRGLARMLVQRVVAWT
jgi:hypothetical protein